MPACAGSTVDRRVPAYGRPDIVAAILDETLPPHVTLIDLASGTSSLWEEQRARARKIL